MKPVFIGVLPNFEPQDYRLARRLLFRRPKSTATQELQTALQSIYPDSQVFLTDSARSAFSLLLKSLSLPEASEVILPSFTCVVLVNPVLWNGLTPIYADINAKDFNTPIEGLISKITDKTKVIVVQHTFGAIIDVDLLRHRLQDVGREDILIVEDLAHSLGTLPAGRFGDFGIATFGVEKVITGIRGGSLLVNKQLPALQADYSKLPELPRSFVRRLLLNPLFWSIAMPVYYWGFGRFTLGRLLVAVAHKLGLLGIQIEPQEYYGGQPTYVPAKLPLELAEIACQQIKRLSEFNKHRMDIAQVYSQRLANSKLSETSVDTSKPHGFLRYPILLADKLQRDNFVRLARENKFVVGDWYKTMFYTQAQHLPKLGYTPGSCPVAEDVSGRIVNLPTAVNINAEQANLLVDILLQAV